jgi:7,8-dihydropterin-6-yl-methyl-4-(beta-D-ribofuranosyl)aminobenzene 5'-phosphate synthase
MQSGDEFIHDDFNHEQNLIIKEENKTLLVAGCAHNGIVNILDHYHNLKDKYPNYVIGGFHLYNLSRNVNEDPILVGKVGEYLLGTGSKYYTGHCTGIVSYTQLKGIVDKNIDYLSTGSQIII